MKTLMLIMFTLMFAACAGSKDSSDNSKDGVEKINPVDANGCPDIQGTFEGEDAEKNPVQVSIWKDAGGGYAVKINDEPVSRTNGASGHSSDFHRATNSSCRDGVIEVSSLRNGRIVESRINRQDDRVITLEMGSELYLLKKTSYY